MYFLNLGVKGLRKGEKSMVRRLWKSVGGTGGRLNQRLHACSVSPQARSDAL